MSASGKYFTLRTVTYQRPSPFLALRLVTSKDQARLTVLRGIAFPLVTVEYKRRFYHW